MLPSESISVLEVPDNQGQSPPKPVPNLFVTLARRLYHPLGFKRGYNFVLFFIFAGALTGFCLAKLQYFNYYGIFCGRGRGGAAPGECFYYLQGHEKVGMILHLAGIVPAGLLACVQFVPIVRHKAILYHRINGYAAIFLAIVGTVGALMIARHSFGGGLEIQTGIGFGAIIFLGSLALAYYNIKRLQIEQHRAWMLRAWFYVCPHDFALRVFVANDRVLDSRADQSSLCDSSKSSPRTPSAAKDTSPLDHAHS